jgi:hypothetical protein
MYLGAQIVSAHLSNVHLPTKTAGITRAIALALYRTA